MKIKYNEGRTLLTMWRVLIITVLCLLIGGAGTIGLHAQQAVEAGSAMLDKLTQKNVNTEVDKIVLYYLDGDKDSGGYYIYKEMYLTHENGLVGLCDAAGNTLLPSAYQEIQALPQSYLVRQNDSWMLIDAASGQPLPDARWDTAQLDRDEKGELASELITVSLDGSYGAVDTAGNTVIEPVYEDFETNSGALWPLIRVRRNGRYGFIDYDGTQVVDISYEYALLSTVVEYEDANDANGSEIPVIYVYRNGGWGIIRRSGNAASAPEWGVTPPDEVIAAFDAERSAQ